MNAAALFVQPKQSRMDHKLQLSATISQLKFEFQSFKYTVYRSAAKVVALQKIFHTSTIPYRLVLTMLERHGMCGNGNDFNFMLPPYQLTSLINDIYLTSPSYKQDSVNTMLANFFWDVFDPYSVSLFEIKVTFLLLCKLFASDMLVTEFYNLLRNTKTKCVPKLHFEYLVNTLSKLFTYIGEDNAYGVHNTSIVMDQCFARCYNTLGLTEQQFHSLWSTSHTRFLIYANLVALVKRLEDTEKLVHNNLCASCQKQQIIGIRFKCQACRNLSLCLRCFATGYATNRHESGHRMYEVFTEDLPPKKISHYFAKLCDMFFPSKYNEDTKGFCSSNETGSLNDTELVTITKQNSVSNISTAGSIMEVKTIQQNTQNSSNEINTKYLNRTEPSPLAGLATTTSNAINVSERLQSLINRLLQQNDKLENQLKLVKRASHEEICDFLNSHQQFLKEIIKEMRNFTPIAQVSTRYPTSSTPCRHDIPMCRNSITSFTAAPSIKGDGNLTHSIYGAEINRTYVEANRSDYSLKDVSVWFSKDPRRMSMPTKPLITVREMSNCEEVEMRETEMANFRLLLQKVKEILEDSYSDNTELAEATQNLENVLDSIIQTEESRRRST